MVRDFYAGGFGVGLHCSNLHRRADEIARLVLAVFGAVHRTFCFALSAVFLSRIFDASSVEYGF